jgi:hypothetical protein
MMFRNMKISASAFNTFLLALFVLGCASGKTEEEKKKDKEVTTMRFHLESNAYAPDQTAAVAVGRGPLMYVRASKDWFLNEGDVERATLLENTDNMGGWAIAIQFNGHGTLVLDSITTRYRNSRVVIWTRADEARFIAAPRMPYRITNGLFKFTPDTTHEEAERIVRGLNNVAKQMHRNDLVK